MLLNNYSLIWVVGVIYRCFFKRYLFFLLFYRLYYNTYNFQYSEKKTGKIQKMCLYPRSETLRKDMGKIITYIHCIPAAGCKKIYIFPSAGKSLIHFFCPCKYAYNTQRYCFCLGAWDRLRSKKKERNQIK